MKKKHTLNITPQISLQLAEPLIFRMVATAFLLSAVVFYCGFQAACTYFPAGRSHTESAGHAKDFGGSASAHILPSPAQSTGPVCVNILLRHTPFSKRNL